MTDIGRRYRPYDPELRATLCTGATGSPLASDRLAFLTLLIQTFS